MIAPISKIILEEFGEWTPSALEDENNNENSPLSFWVQPENVIIDDDDSLGISGRGIDMIPKDTHNFSQSSINDSNFDG